MGMYTKLQCNLMIKKDKKLYEILQNLLEEKDTLDLTKINHDFFKTERYSYMQNVAVIILQGRIILN